MSPFQLSLLLFTFLLPLTTPFSVYGYEQAKVVLFYAGLLLSCTLWLCSRPRLSLNLLKQPICWAATIFLVAFSFSSWQGIDWENSLWGDGPYFQGLVFYFSLALYALLVREARIKWINWFLVWSSSSFLVAVVALYQWFAINSFSQILANYSGRPISSFGSPNLYSGLLVLTWPLTFQLLKRSRYRYWALATLGLNLVAIMASQSRASMITVLIIICLMVLAELWRFAQRRGLLSTMILGLVLVTIVGSLLIQPVFDSYYQQLHAQELEQTEDLRWLQYNAPEKRSLIWPVLWDQSQQHLWWGVGLENTKPLFKQAFAMVNPPYHSWQSLRDLTVDRAHNYLLDLLIWSGVVGLSSWLLLFMVLLLKSRRTIFVWSLLAYFLWIQFQIQSVVHLIFFWWIVGLLTSSLDYGNNKDNA